MLITIELQSQEDVEWLKPILEKFATKVCYKPTHREDQKTRFLSFLEHNSFSVDKIAIPDRDERNER